MSSNRVAKQVGQLDKALSGALLMIGRTVVGQAGRNSTRTGIGSFVNEVVKYGKGVGQLQRTLYYFVPEGESAGGGRLSYGMAQAAKLYIQGGLTDAALRRDRYRGPSITPNKDVYAEWKAKVGLGNLPGMLTGTMAANFGVISNSTGGHSLGIKQAAKTRSPVVGKVPLDYAKKDGYINDYAWKLEFGGDGQEARPLMTGLAAGYLEKVDPEWAELFKDLLLDVYLDAKSGKMATDFPKSAEKEPKPMPVVNQGSAGLAGQLTKAAAAYTTTAKSIKSAAKSLLQLPKAATAGFKGVNKVVSKFRKIGKKHLQRAGTYSTEELAKILQSILDGDD